ncbi:hypothetical protein F5887DRAFT_673723 [Amanita rubescens]|nr:hypothetical protein F5887DRAFT_673723 [Amanita rubescens]
MDLDDVPTTLLSPIFLSQPSSMSSPSLDKFKEGMKEASRRGDWPARICSTGKLQGVLYSVLTSCWRIALSHPDLEKNIIDLSYSDSDGIATLLRSLNDDEVEELKNIVQKGDWVDLIMHRMCLARFRRQYIVMRYWHRETSEISCKSRTDGEHASFVSLYHSFYAYAPYTCSGYTTERLGKAYTQQFIGDFATKFIKHLEQADIGQQTNEQPPLYAKAISVVQSSGTGKSRMLTEVGKQIFTLPICLRKSTDPGYPPGDKPVVDFFSALPKDNDPSGTAHIAIASFLAAAHQMMLETLQEAHNQGLNGPQLLQYWHELMEPTGVRDRREAFFTKVVEQAASLRGEDGEVPPEVSTFNQSRKYYGIAARGATKELMEFLSRILPAKRISVTYFDEAHELGPHLCQIFLRLLQHQPLSIKMWYTLIGTKSSISYYAPPPRKMHSFRLRQEVARLPTPYIDLGFDQQAIAKSRAVNVRMGDMETIQFISQYGRPIWSAHLPEATEYEMIDFASSKLRNGKPFKATDRDHVFAVLSQRLCLDPVIAASEAMELSDRSVAHHMRLLTGFSPHSHRFYTHSPSEPVLVMGSIDILYNSQEPDRLRRVLNTLSQDLCGAGLIEKGILGELGARTLLLIARDFAAPRSPRNVPNLLKPVLLLDFLDTLFGKDIFDLSDRPKFKNTFGDAYVNFTHWINTRDSLPEANEQLLANLWARGGGLQCCFSQERIDLLLPVYHGSVDRDSIFDPSLFSAIAAQIKFGTTGDGNAELAIRPIGVVRDLDKPLPYIAILMELGCEQPFQENGKKIKYLAPGPLADGAFRSLCEARDTAAKNLETNTEKKAIKGLKKKVNDARLAVGSYNRYSISVRGISPDVYGILRTADIVQEFATLLSIIVTSIAEDDDTKKHMRPLERLSDQSHIAWMSDYGVERAMVT